MLDVKKAKVEDGYHWRGRDDEIRELLQRPVSKKAHIPVLGLDMGVDGRWEMGTP